MNATMDPDLLNLAQQHVHDLMTDVEKLTFEVKEDRERFLSNLEDVETRLDRTQVEQEAIKRDLSQKIECVEQRVSLLENQGNESQNKQVLFVWLWACLYSRWTWFGFIYPRQKLCKVSYEIRTQWSRRCTNFTPLYPHPLWFYYRGVSIHALESNCQVIF